MVFLNHYSADTKNKMSYTLTALYNEVKLITTGYIVDSQIDSL